ncbi:MAG: STAS domain-containing protein [Proteobacteria bacterium]|nr:STAS domain-containing protein [Pseudomonadota bacterium]
MFEVSRVHDISVVGVRGELSRRNGHVLDEVLSSLSKCDQHNVVLNFEGLRHLDYRLVQRIAERIIEFQCDGGDLKMAAASGYVRNILEAMGLSEEIYSSVEEALLAFVGDAPDGDLQ